MIPEPPDGSRIEWEHHTDLYAAWRDDKSSTDVGWPADHGWCLYGASVPTTWAQLVTDFGDSLRNATILGQLRRLIDGDPGQITDSRRRELANLDIR